MSDDQSFGDWLRQRRRALDLTQEELARQVGCSAITLRKLEAEERRPSKQIAERLADVLKVAPDDRADFLRFARGDPFAAPADANATDKAQERPGPRHNLPLQLTSFIGREQEITEIQSQFLAARLVTLVGPGGSGKTRLALEVAPSLLAAFPDGVWLSELASLGDPELVPRTVAASLGVQEQAGRPLLATLIGFLNGKTLLLILDNCEQLVAASAQFAQAVLRACPNVRILATSQERLGVAGERLFRVPTLSAPRARDTLSVETALQYAAIRLFAERATVAAPGFAFTPQNLPAVAQVCRQLDGMPLAIELATARLRVFPVEQIATRLDDLFRLLTGGDRTALPRHQTLSALMDWSYELLAGAEQALLRRLAVFAGGWTLEAAEAVGAGDEVAAGDILDLLTRLVEKSLVLADSQAPGEPARYHMLETIRQYALAKLLPSGEVPGVRQRHAAYYLDLAEARAPSNLSSETPPAWLDQQEQEHDNHWAALRWAQSGAGSAEIGLRLAAALTWFWFLRGYYSESQSWLEGALAQPEAGRYPHAQAEVLFKLGNTLGLMGGGAAGQALLTQSLNLFQELGEHLWSAAVLNRLGWLAREYGDFTNARMRLEESLALSRQIGDQAGIASALGTLAGVAILQENTAQARALLEEEQQVLARLKDKFSDAWALNHLGHVALLQGDYGQAVRYYADSLALFQAIEAGPGPIGEATQALGDAALAQGDVARATTLLTQALSSFRDPPDKLGAVWCLPGLAGAIAADGRPERAVRLWGAAEALRTAIGARPAFAVRVVHQRLMAAAREQLGEECFAAAWAEGQAMTMEQAIEMALGPE
jgi:predicted ATPase/DNA-binding XRE family transcriptional regulator